MPPWLVVGFSCKTMTADVSVKKEATVNNPCCKVVSYCFVGFDIIVWFFFLVFSGFWWLMFCGFFFEFSGKRSVGSWKKEGSVW
jgi:hypothetical protein